MLAWLSSDRGLLVVGTSLVLGGLAYIWADCLRLWHVRRKAWDAIDLAATTVFTVMVLAIAMVLRTYDSPAAFVVGGAAAAASYVALRRALRLTAIRGG